MQIYYYSQDFIFDNNSIYISYGPICLPGGRNLGDFVSTVQYHLTFNLINENRDIILVCDENTIALANLFNYRINKVLLTKNYDIITKNTHQLNLHEKAWNNNYSSFWHDLHFDWLKIIDTFNSNLINREKIVLSIQNMQKNISIKPLELQFTKNAIIYPNRSDNEKIPQNILQDLIKVFTKNGYNIILQTDKESIIKQRFNLTPLYIDNCKNITISIEELFYLSQNKENIIIMNRCGLTEILYRLNINAKMIVYQPPDLYPLFKYNNNEMFNYLELNNITKKFYEIFINSSYNDFINIIEN